MKLMLQLIAAILLVAALPLVWMMHFITAKLSIHSYTIPERQKMKWQKRLFISLAVLFSVAAVVLLAISS